MDLMHTDNLRENTTKDDADISVFITTAEFQEKLHKCERIPMLIDILWRSLHTLSAEHDSIIRAEILTLMTSAKSSAPVETVILAPAATQVSTSTSTHLHDHEGNYMPLLYSLEKRIYTFDEIRYIPEEFHARIMCIYLTQTKSHNRFVYVDHAELQFGLVSDGILYVCVHRKDIFDARIIEPIARTDYLPGAFTHEGNSDILWYSAACDESDPHLPILCKRLNDRANNCVFRAGTTSSAVIHNTINLIVYSCQGTVYAHAVNHGRLNDEPLASLDRFNTSPSQYDPYCSNIRRLIKKDLKSAKA